MSLLSMVLQPAIKELEGNPKVVSAVKNLAAAEATIAPILAKLDQGQIAQFIASMSHGKLTEAEVLAVETQIGVVLTEVGNLITEAQAEVK